MNMEIDNAIVGHGYIISRNPPVPADARKLQISPQSFSRLLISPQMLPKNHQFSTGSSVKTPKLQKGRDWISMSDGRLGPNGTLVILKPGRTSTPRIHGPTGKGEVYPPWTYQQIQSPASNVWQKRLLVVDLVGGWTNPFEKNITQIGHHPQFSGWTIKKSLKTTT